MPDQVTVRPRTSADVPRLVEVLDVAVQHDRAVALHRRHGWSVAGEVRPEWLPEGYGPFLVMTPPAVAVPDPGLGGLRSMDQSGTTWR